MDVRQLSLRSAGMFSNVNEVIQQLFLAENRNYRFLINWSNSPYRDEKIDLDPWLYYFEPCWPEIGEHDKDLQKYPVGFL